MELQRVAFKSAAGVLYAMAAGPESGPAVVLLHGFPEFWYGWRKQLPALAEAGFRTIALDQRGYNESAKPRAVRAYALAELSRDVIAVADQLKREQISVVGHDWGGIVAWHVATNYPERLHRAVVLNAPHPAAARHYLLTSPRQLRRSWYVLFFQLPHLPEALFSARGFRAGLFALSATSRSEAFSNEDLRAYKHAWSQPGALTGMVNWYRALARHSRAGDVQPMPVRVPTRILWGRRDAFLLPELAHASMEFCVTGDLIEFPEATHWLQHEEPERVNASLISWLSMS
jgi:pimeloyl-ACP methyl ester carboxylesterase